MTYVIAAPCIADYSCIDICPVNCISPLPSDGEFVDATQMYIEPNACIECAVCAKVCPVSAIYTEEELPVRWRHYARLNREYFQQKKMVR